MRIYLANVGANRSLFNKRKLASPIFEDDRFEFLPIPADDIRLDESPNAVHYRDLRSRYNRSKDLNSYIPGCLLDKAVHNSPEFETFTYCDACDLYSRAANLRRIQPGDVLLFVAGLRRWVDGGRTNEYGLHLIGGFYIEEAPRQMSAQPDNQTIGRFGKNAYVINGRETGRWDPIVGNWLFAGHKKKSRRFNKAVPLNRKICDKVFRDANGDRWRWDRQSETATVASYTRTARCFLDTSILEQANRAATLRKWVAQHSGEADAMLLDGAK